MLSKIIRQLYPEDIDGWKQSFYGRESRADHLVSQALNDFEAFSNSFMGYFDNLIAANLPANTTAERLRAQAFQAYNEYWAPLGEVAAQRQIGLYRDRLDEATDIADQYLQKMGLNLPGALVYFNKATSIKYLPYTDIAFIATPYTQVLFKDWMAIPHELGHYLYWHLGGTLKETKEIHAALLKNAEVTLEQTDAVRRLRSATPAKGFSIRQLILPWLEESFSDIAGVQLAGEDFIRSLQTLIMGAAGSVEDLTEQDGAHVPLCLRPFLRDHAHVLNGKPSMLDAWSGFFADNFGIGDMKHLKLSMNPPDLDQKIAALSKPALLALLSGEDSEIEQSLPSIEYSLASFLPFQNALVEFLDDAIRKAVAKGLPQRQSPAEAFASMAALAEEEAAAAGKQPYEMLLQPRVLEGGDQHGPHSAWATHGKHTVPVHNH